MKRAHAFALLAAAVSATLATTVAAEQPLTHWNEAQLSQPQYPVLMENLVQIKMRDGVSSSASRRRARNSGVGRHSL